MGIDGLLERIGRKLECGDVVEESSVYGTSHNGDKFNIEWSELKTESFASSCESGFGSRMNTWMHNSPICAKPSIEMGT